MNIYECLLLILISSFVVVLFKKLWNDSTSIRLKIFYTVFTIEHFSIAFVFAVFLERFSNIHDPLNFYNLALSADSWVGSFGLGHDFIAFLIYPLVKLGIGIELLFMLFAAISYLGFVGIFRLIGVSTIEKVPLIYLLFFLMPTIHVWSGFLGKEALLIVAMLCFLKYCNDSRKIIWSFVALLVVFLIRPHAAIILLISGIIVLFLDDDIRPKVKFRIGLISGLITSVLIIGFLLFFLRIESLSLSGVYQYIELFDTVTTNQGGSAISIKETTIFSRFFYLLFMPFPFLYEITNKLQWLVAVENVYYMVVFSYMIGQFLKIKKAIVLNRQLRLALVSGILMLILFASYLYNLGLGNRMKLMFLPYLFYAIIKINVVSLDKLKAK